MNRKPTGQATQKKLIEEAYAISARRCRTLFKCPAIAQEWKQLADLLNEYRKEALDRYKLHNVTLKECSTCKTIKPASDFWKDNRQTDGLMTRCKICKHVATQNTRKARRK